MLKICFVTTNEGFCKFYRIKFPCETIAEQGLAETRIVNPLIENEFTEGIIWGDIVVFQYCEPGHLFIRMIETCEKFKKVFIADFDDNYLNIDPVNISYREFGVEEYLPTWVDGKNGFNIDENKKRVSVIKDAIKEAHAVSVTTVTLGDIYRPLNKNIIVLKNCIQPQFMPLEPTLRNQDEVVIGWQGSDSHAADMAYYMKVLEQVKAQYGDKVKFKFFGSALARRFFDKVQGEFVPWCRPNVFFDMFSRHHIDIGLIVIRDTIFNRSKSNIKWLEYSYYGIPTVATKLPPYSNTINHNVNGLLWSNEEQLYHAICALIEDSLLRAKLSGEAKRHVLQHYDVNKNAYKWVEAYKHVFFRKLKNLGTA